MSIRRSRHIVSLVSMLILLLAGQASVQGYVLCVGENGETALEHAVNDSCSPGVQWESRQCIGENAAEPPSEERHCGPCTDLAASFDAATRRHHQQLDFPAEPEPAGNAFAPAVFPARSSTPDAQLYPQTPPRTSRSLIALRTIVLLV